MSGCSCYSSSASSSQPCLFWQENNIGVHYLNSGDYSRAFHFFRSALTNCKVDLDDFQRSCYSCPQRDPTPDRAFLPSTKANASNPPPQQPQQVSSACSDGCIRRGMTASSADSPFGNGGIVNGESMIMVHARAIPMIAIVEPTNTEGIMDSRSHYCYHQGCHFFSADPLQDKNICSAVIVFNLGLVFHLQALQEGEMGGRASSWHRYLTKALNLYQQASRLLSASLPFGTSTGNALVDLVMLALINNSADLSLILLDQETSKALFGQLIQCALSVRASSALYRDSQWIEPMNQRVDSLLFNVTFSRMQPAPSAGAA